jgi:hypothetical protein
MAEEQKNGGALFFTDAPKATSNRAAFLLMKGRGIRPFFEFDQHLVGHCIIVKIPAVAYVRPFDREGYQKHFKEHPNIVFAAGSANPERLIELRFGLYVFAVDFRQYRQFIDLWAERDLPTKLIRRTP